MSSTDSYVFAMLRQHCEYVSPELEQAYLEPFVMMLTACAVPAPAALLLWGEVWASSAWVRCSSARLADAEAADAEAAGATALASARLRSPRADGYRKSGERQT